jgi:hypothetical protein
MATYGLGLPDQGNLLRVDATRTRGGQPPNAGPGELGPLVDREDAVGDQAVGLAVHARRRLGVGRLDQAEDLARGGVDPVPGVLHVVAVLELQVGAVGGLGRCFRRPGAV